MNRISVPLASSGLRAKDIQAAITVLNSGNLTMGDNVRAFENAMASYLGVPFFVMANSGSSANLLMVESLLRPALSSPKVKSGDKVLVPSIAWPTTVWPVLQLGLTPVFVDVNPDNLALDLDKARAYMNQSDGTVKAMFPIHPLGFGLPRDYEDFCTEFGLTLINDMCESLGSFRDGRHSGNSGHASSYSFYFSHHLTTMEGGGVATSSAEVADDLRAMRSHGWSRDRADSDSWVGGVTSNQAKFLFVTSGYNVRPMELQAAIGLSQLDDLNDFIERRRRISEHVRFATAQSGLQLIDPTRDLDKNPRESHSWMLLPIRVIDEGLDRDVVVAKLNQLGVETRPILTGNFLAQPAASRILPLDGPAESYSVAEDISKRCFMVSAHHDLTDEQIDHLCSALVSASRV
jgi:CDP-6-deoxy-D-xylo-4-hexulose-3-dehydrase